MKLRLRTFAGAPVLAVAIALALLAPASVSAGGSSIRFGTDAFEGLMAGGNCIYGWASPGSTVNLTWRSSGGSLKAQGSVPADTDSGHWEFCATGVELVRGDRLKANDGSTQRTFKMPHVTLKVDRVANEFRGRAPANSMLTLHSHSLFSDFYESTDLNANAQGRWQFDNDGNDVPGGTDAYLDWFGPLGDTVTAHDTAPEIHVTVGRAEFTGFVRPGLEIRLELRDNSTDAVKAIGNAVGGEFGEVRGQFRDLAGHKVPVSVGDRVVAHALADDLDWNVPAIEATANVATDVVNGACRDAGNPGGLAIVEVNRAGGRRVGFSIVGVDPSGEFEVDFGGSPNPFHNPANIKHGDKLTVKCMLGTGDWVHQTFLVP
jgi:hypothetical protein